LKFLANVRSNCYNKTKYVENVGCLTGSV
jgi:hypothetical protein